MLNYSINNNIDRYFSEGKSKNNSKAGLLIGGSLFLFSFCFFLLLSSGIVGLLFTLPSHIFCRPTVGYRAHFAYDRNYTCTYINQTSDGQIVQTYPKLSEVPLNPSFVDRMEIIIGLFLILGPMLMGIVASLVLIGCSNYVNLKYAIGISCLIFFLSPILVTFLFPIVATLATIFTIYLLGLPIVFVLYCCFNSPTPHRITLNSIISSVYVWLLFFVYPFSHLFRVSSVIINQISNQLEHPNILFGSFSCGQNDREPILLCSKNKNGQYDYQHDENDHREIETKVIWRGPIITIIMNILLLIVCGLVVGIIGIGPHARCSYDPGYDIRFEYNSRNKFYTCQYVNITTGKEEYKDYYTNIYEVPWNENYLLKNFLIFLSPFGFVFLLLTLYLGFQVSVIAKYRYRLSYSQWLIFVCGGWITSGFFLIDQTIRAIYSMIISSCDSDDEYNGYERL